MKRTLSRATRGYLSDPRFTLSISSMGYLIKQSIFPPDPGPDIENYNRGGFAMNISDSEINKRIPRYRDDFVETRQDKIKREDIEILTIIKIFLKCKN